MQNGARLSTSRLAQNGLNIAAGGAVTLLAGGGTSVISSLTLDAAATLDITDNPLVINYTGASPVATVRTRILSGRGGPGLAEAGPAWASPAARRRSEHVRSRIAIRGLCRERGAAAGAVRELSWAGGDATSVLIAYTHTGDANLDGVVDDNDVTVVGATYARDAAAAVVLGDFDYNGFVADDDVTLLGVFYQPGAGVAAAPAAAKDELRSTKYEVQSTKHGVPDNALVELLAEETAQLGR